MSYDNSSIYKYLKELVFSNKEMAEIKEDDLK